MIKWKESSFLFLSSSGDGFLAADSAPLGRSVVLNLTAPRLMDESCIRLGPY